MIKTVIIGVLFLSLPLKSAFAEDCTTVSGHITKKGNYSPSYTRCKTPSPKPSKTPTPKPSKTPTPKPFKTPKPLNTSTPKPAKTPNPKPSKTPKPNYSIPKPYTPQPYNQRPPTNQIQNNAQPYNQQPTTNKIQIMSPGDMAQTLNLSIETVNDWIKRNYWLDFWAYPESKDWYYDPNLEMFRKK